MPFVILKIILGLLAIFIASFTQGFIGFGFSQVAIPLMAAFMPAKAVIPILLLLGVVLNLIIIYDIRKFLDIKRILILLITGTLGIPIGAYLLVILDVEILKIFIGAAIIFSSAAIFYGKKINIKSERAVAIPVGFLSGILNGSITMSGPPVILFFSNQGMPKDDFRANLIGYFLWLNLVTIPIYIAGGLMDINSVKSALIFSPALIAGTALGVIASKKIGADLFKKLVLIVLTLLGLSLIVSGMAGMR